MTLATVDGIGNVTTESLADVAAAYLSEDPSDRVAHVGEWRREETDGAIAGAVHVAATPESSLEAVVTGDEAAIVAMRGPAGGQATVSLDGEAVATVDLYAPEPGGPEVVATVGLVPGTRHVLSVTPDGSADRRGERHRHRDRRLRRADDRARWSRGRRSRHPEPEPSVAASPSPVPEATDAVGESPAPSPSTDVGPIGDTGCLGPAWPVGLPDRVVQPGPGGRPVAGGVRRRRSAPSGWAAGGPCVLVRAAAERMNQRTCGARDACWSASEPRADASCAPTAGPGCAGRATTAQARR